MRNPLDENLNCRLGHFLPAIALEQMRRLEHTLGSEVAALARMLAEKPAKI